MNIKDFFQRRRLEKARKLYLPQLGKKYSPLSDDEWEEHKHILDEYGIDGDNKLRNPKVRAFIGWVKNNILALIAIAIAFCSLLWNILRSI